MTDVDADYGAEDHEYVPGVPVRERVRTWWDGVFGGWRPDQRTVGVFLVAWFVGIVIDRLVTVDLSWTTFVNAMQGQDFFRQVPVQQVIGATTRLLFIPAEVVLLAGAVGLVLRRGWGRRLAAAGLAALLAMDLTNAVSYLSTVRGGVEARSGIGQLIDALSSALPLAVLLWSREPEVDG